MTTRRLIHIGFPKCGSTSLQAWFSAHPAVAYDPHGFAGYADAPGLSRAAASLRTPACHVTSSESLVIPRPREDLIDLPRDGSIAERRQAVCELLAALFPNASILIVTRGYREVLASIYSDYVRVGGTQAMREFMVGRRDPSGVVAVEIEDYFDYDATTDLYELVFGAENVIVLPFELLREEPAVFFAALEDHLGLEPGGDAPGWLNPSLTPAELTWYPRFSRGVARVSKALGSRAPEVLAAYRGRIGGPGLRRAATLLAGSTPAGPLDLDAVIPAGVVERFRGRADALARRPIYDRYRDKYLADEPARTDARED